MVKIESTTNSRIPFSQRLFWSIFAMFLGFTACFLLFQYQREREFAQEKLNNVLGNYNYQLFRRTQQTEDINQVVHQFIDDIPQKDLRVTIIDPAGKIHTVVLNADQNFTYTLQDLVYGSYRIRCAKEGKVKAQRGTQGTPLQ